MRIRTQNLLFIGPIFAGLAVGIGVFSYREQVAEVNWGMAEGLEALTLATAGLIDAQACAELAVAKGTAHAAARERLRAPLERIRTMDLQKERLNRSRQEEDRAWTWVWRRLPGLGGDSRGQLSAWERLRRVTVVGPDGQRLLFDLSVAADVEPGDASLPHMAAAAADGQVVLYYRTMDDRVVTLARERAADADGLVQVMGTRRAVYAGARRVASGATVACGWAPVVDLSGALAALLRVEVDAAPLEEQRARARARAVVLSAAIVACGVLAALLISTVVTRGIRELYQAARAAVAGDYEQRVGLHTIQEVADLGSTFNTTNDVLREVVSRTRRELIDGEQFRSSRDLAESYRRTYWAPQEVRFGEVEVAARVLASRPTGDFRGAFEARGRVHVLLGRVRTPGDLEAVTTASAVYRYLCDALTVSDPEEVLAQARTLFEMESFVCVWWRGDDHAVRWLADRSAGQGAPTQGALVLADRQSVVFHSLRPEEAAVAECYGRLFNHLPPSRLAADLTAVLGDPGEGGAAALGRWSERTDASTTE
ncbi:MAG: HAMP domain-containing protein [Candidatus Latescibacterota bacterium]